MDNEATEEPLENMFFEPEEGEEAPAVEEPENKEATAVDETEAPEAEAEAEEQEAPAEKEEEAEFEDETVFVLKRNGEETEYSQADALELAQKGFDYTQKTQEHSANVKAFEAEKTQTLGQLKDALSYYALPQSKEPQAADFAGRPPQEFVDAFNAYQQTSARQDEAKQLLDAVTAEETRVQNEEFSRNLLEAMPEWTDPAVRQAEFDTLSSFAAERYGFAAEDVAGVSDHRLLLLLRDAARVGEIDAKPVVMKRKTEVKKKMGAGAKEKANLGAAKHDAVLSKLTEGKALNGEETVSMFFTE